MNNFLFVCTGNTCRSPMAESVLRHYANETHSVKSAGVFAMPGESASKHAIQALQKKGITIDHSSKQINDELLDWSSVILTMTGNHKQFLLTRYPQHKEKLYTLYEYVNGENKDISDPYGGSLSTYENTLNELEELILKIIQKNEK